MNSTTFVPNIALHISPHELTMSWIFEGKIKVVIQIQISSESWTKPKRKRAHLAAVIYTQIFTYEWEKDENLFWFVYFSKKRKKKAKHSFPSRWHWHWCCRNIQSAYFFIKTDRFSLFSYPFSSFSCFFFPFLPNPFYYCLFSSWFPLSWHTKCPRISSLSFMHYERTEPNSMNCQTWQLFRMIFKFFFFFSFFSAKQNETNQNQTCFSFAQYLVFVCHVLSLLLYPFFAEKKHYQIERKEKENKGRNTQNDEQATT